MNETVRMIKQAVKRGDLTTEEAARFAEAIGVRYSNPIKVCATGYLYTRGTNRVSVCQKPGGITDNMHESDKYVDTYLIEDLHKEYGYGWGGTKVKVTIEEVL